VQPNSGDLRWSKEFATHPEQAMNRAVNLPQVNEKYFVYYDAVQVGEEFFPCITVERSVPDGEARSASVQVRDFGPFRSFEEARRAGTQLDVVEVGEDGSIHLGTRHDEGDDLPQ